MVDAPFLGALILDSQGLVLAGSLTSRSGFEEALGAILGDSRALGHLGGERRQRSNEHHVVGPGHAFRERLILDAALGERDRDPAGSYPEFEGGTASGEGGQELCLFRLVRGQRVDPVVDLGDPVAVGGRAVFGARHYPGTGTGGSCFNAASTSACRNSTSGSRPAR